MSSIEANFTPLQEAQNRNVHFKIELPSFVDANRIGVNLSRIQRLCQIGGIHHLTVIGAEEQDTLNNNLLVAGFNNQGSAYIGKTSTKVDTPFLKTTSDQLKNNSAHTQQWSNTIITINLSEVSKQISNSTKWIDPLRSPKAWSYYLDQGVKTGISQEGSSQLLNINRSYLLFAAYIILKSADIGPIPIIHDLNPHIPNISEVANDFFLTSFAFNLVDRLRGNKPILDDKNTRYTFFYGPEIDRAIILKILANSSVLLKQIGDN